MGESNVISARYMAGFTLRNVGGQAGPGDPMLAAKRGKESVIALAVTVPVGSSSCTDRAGSRKAVID
jgi:hypothetical protein